MMNVSTPDASQSEAYISTVALFLIFACHLKEERLYFRLPSAFRDLWTEMSNARKEHTNAKDQDKLRQLKRMISEFDAINRDRTLSENNLVDPLVRKKKEFNVILDNKSSFSSQNASNNDLIRLWLSKSSTSTYNDMLKSRTKLPIWAYKPALLAAIENHQIVIVCGETGCGKSTQVPAFIIEHELSIGRECRVYCTQPRRISAISLARRVSEELGEQKLDIGTARSLIGYAIRLESQMTTQTRLVYATTGIVMRMLERSDDLGDITHLVLDEVHERSIDSDFLLIVLRKLVVRRPLLKVILMSATVDAERFSKYLAGAPILTVPGRTFPVLTKYLEDVLEIADVDDEETPASHSVVNLSEDENEIETHKKSAENGMKGYSKKTCEILQNFDEYRISYGLILNLLEVIATQNMYTTYSKAVLVFLPGIAEIRHLNNVISNHPSFSRGWRVHLLHSTIASEEQEQAFLVPPQGTRKIVLATNIAETGITIPDVTCVIDTGKHKEMRFFTL